MNKENLALVKISYGVMFNKYVLRTAAIYNILWGTWVVIFPDQFFQWTGIQPVNHKFIWQCLGMVIGIYGLGYWWASFDYLRHWPIVAIGLIGKILGPIGFFINYFEGKIPVNFIYTLIPNDFIWWIPLTIILLDVHKKTRCKLKD